MVYRPSQLGDHLPNFVSLVPIALTPFIAGSNLITKSANKLALFNTIIFYEPTDVSRIAIVD
jgi:hypothetical protein